VHIKEGQRSMNPSQGRYSAKQKRSVSATKQRRLDAMPYFSLSWFNESNWKQKVEKSKEIVRREDWKVEESKEERRQREEKIERGERREEKGEKRREERREERRERKLHEMNCSGDIISTSVSAW